MEDRSGERPDTDHRRRGFERPADGGCWSRRGIWGAVGTTNPLRALELFRPTEPDLVILDLMMPQMNGFEVMEQLQSEIDKDDYLPILVLTADTQNETRLRALLLGAKDFITKPMDRLEVLLRVRILLDTRFKYQRAASRLR